MDALISKFGKIVTFLDLVHEYLFNSTLIVFWDKIGKDLLGLSCVFETLVVVIDEEDQFVLKINNPLIIINHFYSV